MRLVKFTHDNRPVYINPDNVECVYTDRIPGLDDGEPDTEFTTFIRMTGNHDTIAVDEPLETVVHSLRTP